MREVLFFAYRPGRSPLHRIDVRLKLALAALVTAAAWITGLPGLFALLAAGAALHAAAGVVPAGLAAVLPLALIVVAGRGLGQSGGAGWLLFSPEGLVSGLTYAVRLLVLALFASLLVSTTTTAALRAGFAWLLAPLPRRWRVRAATMAGLAMASLPLLAREIELVRLARAARLADRSRNATDRILSFVRPVLAKTLLRADTLAAAMEARGFSDSVPPPPLPRPRLWEWAAAAAAAAAVAGFAALVPR